MEYSTDGRNFSLLQFVASRSNNGYSAAPLLYHAQDDITTAGKVFYRLKQIDKNGQSQYSKTISLSRYSTLAQIAVYPNPVSNHVVQFSCSDTHHDLNVEIIDVQGRILVSHRFLADQFNTTETLSAPYLNDGFYWMSFESGGNKVVKKILFKEVW